MATNPSAFGPISPGTKRAASLLGGGTRGGTGGYSLGRLTARRPAPDLEPTPSLTEPVGLASGTQAPVEEFTPLLPEGEATGDRGDITQLPGFQSATEEGGVAEVPEADDTAGVAEDQRATLQRLLEDSGPSGTTVNLNKALRSFNAALKTAGAGKRIGAELGLTGGAASGAPNLSNMGFSLFGSSGSSPVLDPSAFSLFGQSPASVLKPSDFSLGAGAGTAAPGAAGSLASGVSAGGAGAGALAAILGLIAQQSGNADLGKAATALGAAGSAAASGGSIAAGTAGSSLAAGAGPAAAGVGLGTAAGAAYAPIAAAFIASAISGLAGGDDPLGEGVNEMILQSGNDYQTFNQELGRNVGQQQTAFGALREGLPYVQDKAELGRLLNTYKHYLGSTTGIPMEDQGGIYQLGNIPDVGPMTHGQATTEQNWGPITQQFQSVVDQLYGALPGEALTQDYAGGGGLAGEPANRLWNAFVQNPSSVPTQLSQLSAMGPEELAQQQAPLFGGGTVGGLDLMNAQAQGNLGRQPVYDPASGQYVFAPETGGPRSHAETFQMSPVWRMLTSQDGGGEAPAPDPTAPAVAPDPRLERLMAQARPSATGTPLVPEAFTDTVNPAALNRLLAQQPGLLAQLFGPQGVA